jgi:predicted enzyme related to lactoylglutathione lyase
MVVIETFFSIEVRDKARATAFYVEALGASVTFAAPVWTSIQIAGVRVGLFLHPEQTPGRVGLHFVVSDLPESLAHVVQAGGSVVAAPREVAPGVVVADVADTEGNVFALRQA